MVRARPPSAPKPLQFAGYKPYPIDPVPDDWGLSPQDQETYVEQFRQLLVKHNAWQADVHDYYTLRRFLRARGYDLERALKMWQDHLAWRETHGIDDILQTFYFDERETFLSAYPQGYHKTDRMGRPVYIQLIGQINLKGVKACTTEERMFKFHVQEYERCLKVILPICSRLAGRQIDQTFGIMDVRGVGLAHLSGEVKKLLGYFVKTDQDNYPETLGHICMINAPIVFRAVWSVIKTMLDVRTQGKIEILGPNYMPALSKHVDPDNVPMFMGGRSPGTLLDDVGPWSDPELIRALGMDLEELRQGRRPAPAMLLSLPSFGRASSERDGSFVTTASSVNGRGPLVNLTTTSAVSNASGDVAGSSGAVGGLAAIPESRTRTLVERIKAIESMLPSQLERLRASNAQGGAEAATASTRSAPEGSLLNRVEVLEEALDTLLQAQAAMLAQQRATEAALAEARRAADARCSCCTIM